MTTKTASAFVPKINEPLVRETMQAIADDLEAWNQAFYVRDNADGKRQFCFAGRALVIQGYTLDWFLTTLRFFDTNGDMIGNVTEEAGAELGLTERQAVDIFGWMTDVDLPKEEQFAEFAEFVLAQTGIDCR